MKTLFYSITDYWVVARERETDQVVWKLYLRSYLWHLKKRPHILLQTGEKFLVASWAGGNVTIDAENFVDHVLKTCDEQNIGTHGGSGVSPPPNAVRAEKTDSIS